MYEEIHTREAAWDTILRTAADIANLEISRLQEAGTLDTSGLGESRPSGEIYRPDQGRSEKDGMCLSVDEMFTKGRSPEQIEALHEIGRNAITESITTHHPKLFVGVILGELKAGRDTFNRPDHDQLRMF